MLQDNNQEEEQNNIENNESVRAHYSGLPKSQKIAVAVLAFFAVFVVIIWSMQIRDNIFSPFDRDKNISNQPLSGVCTGPECASNQNMDSDLMNQDTDNDGLTDWEELTIYKTSPYLEDSDSDGINDKDEIDLEKNPLCKEGDICDVVSNASTGEVSEEPVNAPDAPVVSVPDASKVPLSESEEEALLMGILQGQGDAATLRNLLIQAGMDERLLNQLSDEDLLNSYQEVLGQ
ncbi:hypothetical protein KAR28_03570 [Candidatus Parcubacteria bacterium]|nr:hypothetical protein [Candidatus Parcubacteria bacterium]